MKKIIFLHSDMHRRDTEAVLLMKRYLEDLGQYKVLIISRFSLRLMYMLFGSYGIWIVSTFMPTSMRNLRGNVAVLQVEGFVENKILDITFTENYPYKKIFHYFVWNEIAEKYLIEKRGIDKNKISIMGSYRLPLIKEYEENNADKIGIVGRNVYLSSYKGGSFMDSLLRSFVKTSDYDVSFTEYAKYEMDNLTRIFKYTKGFWDKLYFRPHPNENVNDYKELQKLINCKIDNNYSFLKWISECKAVIAPVSSTCVEIALLKKPILNINDDTTSFFKVEKYDVAGEYFDNISTPLSKFSFDKLNDKKLLNKTVENELNIILDKYYNGGVTRYDIFKEALDNIKAKTLPYTIFKSFRILTELAMMTRNILIIIKGGKIAKDYSYTTFTKVTTKNDKAFDYCKNNNGIIKLK